MNVLPPLGSRILAFYCKAIDVLHVRHCRVLLFTLTVLGLPCTKVLSQPTPTCDFYQTNMRNGMCMIGGTTIPWAGRTGSGNGNGPITLTGTVTLHQMGLPVNINNVQVYVAFGGQPQIACAVTPSVINPLQGSWAYKGPVQAIPVMAGTYVIEFIAKYNNAIMMSPNGAGPQDIKYSVNVFQVESTAGTVVDTVNQSTDCWLSGTRLFSCLNTGGARSISTGYTITPPAGVSVPANNTITVGIIQTVTESLGAGFGFTSTPTVPGSGPTENGLLTVLYPTFSMWDGLLPAVGPYYSTAAVASPAAATAPGLAYVSGANIGLADLPWWGFPQTINFPGVQYNPPIFNVMEGLYGSLYGSQFEDMLTASSADWPGVYVPIEGFSQWSVNFSGFALSSVWFLGGVTAGGLSSNIPITTSALGPSNNFGSQNVTATP